MKRRVPTCPPDVLQALEAERDALATRVKRVDAHLRNQATPDALIEDPGSVHQNDQVLEHLSGADHLRLERVTAALERVVLGTFGLCIDCDAVIAPERIRAMPWALRCIGCESERTKHRPA